MHVVSGLVVLALLQWLSQQMLLGVAGLALLAAWSMEIGRRYSDRINVILMWVFRKVAHRHEQHRINSSTWFTTAMFTLALTTSPMVGSVAVTVLGFGDPAAAWFGRRYGRTRLASGRSIEGSLAFVAVGGLCAVAVMQLFYSEIAWGDCLALAFAGALAGALAELLTQRLDDNLVIPLAAAGGTVAMRRVLGL